MILDALLCSIGLALCYILQKGYRQEMLLWLVIVMNNAFGVVLNAVGCLQYKRHSSSGSFATVLVSRLSLRIIVSCLRAVASQMLCLYRH